jgi:hypothetical protein
MKRFFGIAIVLVLLSVPAFAAKSETVNFSGTVKVGTVQLPAGQYKVTWTPNGSDAQVTLAQGKKILVTVTAKVVEQKHNLNGVTTNTLGGVEVLQTIQLDRVSLVLESSPASGQ